MARWSFIGVISIAAVFVSVGCAGGGTAQPVATERIAKMDSTVAAQYLDSIGPRAASDPRARATLLAFLKHHRNTRVADRAGSWLAKSGKPAVGPLIKLLGDAHPSIQARAARALGMIGRPARDAVKPLIELVASEQDWVARTANAALRSIAPKLDKGEPLLAVYRALKFKDGYERAQAVYDAGWLGLRGKRAFPILVNMLADTSDQIRATAASALVRAGPAARSAVERGLVSQNDRVRMQSMLVLTKIEGPI